MSTSDERLCYCFTFMLDGVSAMRIETEGVAALKPHQGTETRFVTWFSLGVSLFLAKQAAAKTHRREQVRVQMETKSIPQTTSRCVCTHLLESRLAMAPRFEEKEEAVEGGK